MIRQCRGPTPSRRRSVGVGGDYFPAHPSAAGFAALASSPCGPRLAENLAEPVLFDLQVERTFRNAELPGDPGEGAVTRRGRRAGGVAPDRFQIGGPPG